MAKPEWKARNNHLNEVRSGVSLRPGPGGVGGVAKLDVKIGPDVSMIPITRDETWALIAALQKLLQNDGAPK